MQPDTSSETDGLPRTEQGLIRLQEFVDPIFGSERYIKFKPEWVTEVEDKLLRLFFAPWRKFAVTRIKFVNGQQYTVDGYWAEQIKAAMPPDLPSDTDISL